VSKFQEIMAAGLQPDAPAKYYKDKGSIRIPQPNSPYSIRENEFNFLETFIVEHNLKSGFYFKRQKFIVIQKDAFSISASNTKLCPLVSS
jgi:hypothetical protein